MMTFGEILEDVMSQAIPNDGRDSTMGCEFLLVEFDDNVDSDGDDWWDE